LKITPLLLWHSDEFGEQGRSSPAGKNVATLKELIRFRIRGKFWPTYSLFT